VVSSCVIVDDSARFLELSRALLERDGIKVVGTASSAAEGLSCVVERRPDVALVDIDLGEDDGFDLLRDLESGDTAVILISAHAEVDFGDLIDASSALGFIPKTELSASAVHDLVDGDGENHADG
jgi:DNA-binding NarL/FixJ family response regulator